MRAKTLAELAKADELAGIHFVAPSLPRAAEPRIRRLSSIPTRDDALIEGCQGCAVHDAVSRSRAPTDPARLPKPPTDGERCCRGDTDSNSVKAHEALAYSRESVSRRWRPGAALARRPPIVQRCRASLRHRDTGPIAEFF